MPEILPLVNNPSSPPTPLMLSVLQLVVHVLICWESVKQEHLNTYGVLIEDLKDTSLWSPS